LPIDQAQADRGIDGLLGLVRREAEERCFEDESVGTQAPEAFDRDDIGRSDRPARRSNDRQWARVAPSVTRHQQLGLAGRETVEAVQHGAVPACDETST
jgi:hypothetical protein